MPHHFSVVDAMVAAESNPVALVLTTLSGEILYTNPAFRTLFGVPDLDAHSGLNLQEIAFPGIDRALLAELARVGEPRQFALQTRLAGSESRWWCHARRERGEAGIPTWLILTFTELGSSAAGWNPTLRLDEAQEQAEHLEHFGTWTLAAGPAQHAPLGPMCWSRGMSELLGREHSAGPRPAREWLDAIHKDDRAPMIDALRTLIAEGRDYSVEYRLADDSGRRLLSRGHRLPSLAGSEATLGGIERDVTQHVLVSRADRELFYLQRALADCNELPAFALDLHARLRWFNPLFAALMIDFWDAAPSADWTLAHIVRQPAQRSRALHSVRQSLSGVRSVAEWSVAARGAERRSYDLTSSPIRDGNGQICGVAAMLADVTARHASEQRRPRRGRRSLVSSS